MGRSNILVYRHHYRSRTWDNQARCIDELFSRNEIAQLDFHHTHYRKSILYCLGFYALAG